MRLAIGVARVFFVTPLIVQPAGWITGVSRIFVLALFFIVTQVFTDCFAFRRALNHRNPRAPKLANHAEETQGVATHCLFMSSRSGVGLKVLTQRS